MMSRYSNMLRKAWPVMWTALLLLAAPAWADIVVLKNGKTLEGRVEDHGDTVIVHMGYGSVSIPRAQIKDIVRKETALDTYKVKLDAVQAKAKAGDLEGAALGDAWFKLAEWCASERIPRGREDCLKRAIEADPDHAQARQALGYLRVGDAWVTGDKRNEALGLVKFEGQWVTPEAAADAEKAAEANRKAALEADMQTTELQLKQAQLDKIEAERALLLSQAERNRIERERLEIERLELDRERARNDYWRRYYGPLLLPPYSQPLVRPRPPAKPNRPSEPKDPDNPKDTGDADADKGANDKPSLDKTTTSPPPPHRHGSQLNNGTSGPGMPVTR